MEYTFPVNWLDVYLGRQLLYDGPFSQGYEQVTKAWTSMAVALSKTVNPDDGSLLYGGGISVKTCKDRFAAFMAYAKEHIKHVPFESGQDDQEAPNELQRAVEEMYAMQLGIDDAKTMLTFQSAAKKEEEKAKAEAIRRASLGLLSGTDKSSLKSDKENGSNGSNKES